MKESPFIAVLKRELDRMVSRRIYFASCIVLPLFSIFFMATIFGNEMCIRDRPSTKEFYSRVLRLYKR